MQVVCLILGLLMFAFITLDISHFNRMPTNRWTPLTTFIFLKNVLYAIVAIFLICNAGA